MPGIVGLITKMPSDCARQQLSRMVEAIRHESFYTVGTWVDESLGVYVGWVARKGSFSDGMPLCNERGDAVLVFSGEEYSERATSADLRRRGHDVKTGSASYLVHLYEEDSNFPVSLNGRFQGLLTDRNDGSSILFNDRYGIHRVYYYECKDTFYFSPEAKAILAVRPELRVTDTRSLGEYISCGCVLENRTLFRDMALLPPGSAWTFRNGALEQKKSYFQPKEWEDQETLEPEKYYQALRDTFGRVIPRYFEGKEPIGMSLTGGLDTRMILAWRKPAPGTLPCYSFGGMFRECEDVRLARKLAQVCGQSFETIPVGQEFLSHFSELAERTVYLTDGCATVRFSSDLYANQRAAQIAPVRMTGNYGGEVLRQLRAFKPLESAANLFQPELRSRIREARKTYGELLNTHAVSFIAFRQVPWHHYGLLALEQTQLSLRSPYLDNEIIRLAYREPAAAVLENKLFKESQECVRLITDGNAALARIRTDRGLAGSSGKPISSIISAWLEFTFKAEYAYDYGMPQWLTRLDNSVAWLHLERLFLGRHKFNHFRFWYKGVLTPYVREILLDPRTLARPYVVRRNLESLVRDHCHGNGNYTTEIHTFLTLELFHRLFVDSN